MESARLVVALRDLLKKKGTATATVGLVLVQQELQRRRASQAFEDTAVQCVICFQVVACPEMTCTSCRCEGLYHYECLSHASMKVPGAGTEQLRCPTCRDTVTRSNVSIQLRDLALRKQRAWSDAALPALAQLEQREQQVLKDGEKSRLHEDLYRLRVEVYELRRLRCSGDLDAGVGSGVLTKGLLQLSAPQLRALVAVGRGQTSSAARPAGLCCGLCSGFFSTYSELWSQGCLRCSADTSLQTFYHRECLELALPQSSTVVPICLSCGDGAVQREAFGVKQRLNALERDVRLPVTIEEAVSQARQTCRSVDEEWASLLHLRKECVGPPTEKPAVVKGARSRSPRRPSMLSLRG